MESNQIYVLDDCCKEEIRQDMKAKASAVWASEVNTITVAVTLKMPFLWVSFHF